MDGWMDGQVWRSSPLASLLPDKLINVPHTLALVGLWLTLGADDRCKLADLLLAEA